MHASQPRTPSHKYRTRLLGVLISLLISACGTPDRAAQPTAAIPRATAVPPSTVLPPTLVAQLPTVLPTQTSNAQQGQTAPTPIPNCTFNTPASPEPQVPPLDAYTFSEPKVVLTDTRIGINEWLPDNQRLLITRPSNGGKSDLFETLDVHTGATQLYAEQSGPRTKPVWLDTEQAVAFTEVRPNNQVVLRLAHGNGLPIEDVATDLASPFLSASTDGQQLTFITRTDHGQARVLQVGQARQSRLLAGSMRDTSAQPLPVELGVWEAMRAAWRPDGTQIAFYSKAGISLTDTTTGQECNVTLGGDRSGQRWPLEMRWSPDGRFLAAITSIGGRIGQLSFTDLTILDTTTGALHYADLGVGYIYEFAWLPNSRQVIALGRIDGDAQGAQLSLFIANSVSGETRQLLPKSIFRIGIYTSSGGALALSHDGQRIAARCPSLAIQSLDTVKDQLCLIDVHTQP